jgi:hypothetical protein
LSGFIAAGRVGCRDQGRVDDEMEQFERWRFLKGRFRQANGDCRHFPIVLPGR